MKKNEKKRALYQNLIEDMELAFKDNYYFETSWYACAIIEDRVLSALEKTGGVPLDKKGKPIIMLGTKIKILEERVKTDAALKEAFVKAPDLIENTTKWLKKFRNPMIHALAGNHGLKFSTQQLKIEMKKMAEAGKKICRDWASMVSRFKNIKKRNEKAKLTKKIK